MAVYQPAGPMSVPLPRLGVSAGEVSSPSGGFQYFLGAATSIATKLHEETMTYLNQGVSPSAAGRGQVTNCGDVWWCGCWEVWDPDTKAAVVAALDQTCLVRNRQVCEVCLRVGCTSATGRSCRLGGANNGGVEVGTTAVLPRSEAVIRI